MFNDARRFARACPECVIVTGGGRASRPPLHPIPVSKPFQILGIDVMDLPLTDQGNKHVVVIQDLFTKWPVICHLCGPVGRDRLTGDLPFVRSSRESSVHVYFSLTGNLPFVRSCRQGWVHAYFHNSQKHRRKQMCLDTPVFILTCSTPI